MKLMIPGYLLPEIVTGNLLYFLLLLISLAQPFILFRNRSSHRTCSITEFTGKHPCQSFFLITQACNLVKKEVSTQVFSCEFCENFKNTFRTEHLRATASVANSSSDQVFLEMSYLVRIIHIYFDINSSFVSQKS